MAYEPLRRTHRKPLTDNLLRRIELLIAVGHRQQRSRVTHVELTRLQQRLDAIRQLQKPQQIADRRATPADCFSCLLVGQAELPNQAVQGFRFFEWIQVLALDVFDERHRNGCIVLNVTHDRRYLLQPCHLGCTPAALAGNDFIALRCAIFFLQRPRNYGLHHTLGLYRRSQILQRILADIIAWLILPALQQIERDILECVHLMPGDGGCLIDGLAEQRIECASQSLFPCHALGLLIRAQPAAQLG